MKQSADKWTQTDELLAAVRNLWSTVSIPGQSPESAEGGLEQERGERRK
jgi:hypothetical protein